MYKILCVSIKFRKVNVWCHMTYMWWLCWVSKQWLVTRLVNHLLIVCTWFSGTWYIASVMKVLIISCYFKFEVKESKWQMSWVFHMQYWLLIQHIIEGRRQLSFTICPQCDNCDKSYEKILYDRNLSKSN